MSVAPCVVLLIPALAAAVDYETSDARLLLGTYVGIDRVTAHDERGRMLSDRLIGNSLGRGLELDFVRTASGGPLTWYVQAGAATRYARGEDDNGDVRHIYAGGGLVGGGLCLRPLPHVRLELGPTVTVGMYVHNGLSSSDSYGYAAGDLRTGLWWTGGNIQVGLVVGAAAQMAKVETTWQNSSRTLTTDYSGHGGFVLVGIGYRL